MTFSRVGVLPLSYMVVAKGLMAVCGFVAATGLRTVYRRTLSPGSSTYRVILVVIAASFVGSFTWNVLYRIAVITLAAPLWGIMGTPHRIQPPTVGDGLVYNALTLLAWSMLYLGVKFQHAAQRSRERALRAEADSNEAQLRALRYQINPHLLFNTFNAISTLIVEHRAEDAADMIAKVSDFLRMTLAGSSAPEIPLDTELAYVRKYLEIEQIRFGDRLRVDIDVAGDAGSCLVPALILQPLVENAMKYAVAPRVEGASLVIRAAREGGEIAISVRDDGPGVQATPDRDTTKLGLANTRARLAQMYGDDVERLQLLSPPGGGCTVRLRIPAHHAP